MSKLFDKPESRSSERCLNSKCAKVIPHICSDLLIPGPPVAFVRPRSPIEKVKRTPYPVCSFPPTSFPINSDSLRSFAVCVSFETLVYALEYDLETQLAYLVNVGFDLESVFFPFLFDLLESSNDFLELGYRQDSSFMIGFCPGDGSSDVLLVECSIMLD